MPLELMPTLARRKGTIYTCPMHPQVQQDHPGECPICGMSLEPKTVDVEDEGEGFLRRSGAVPRSRSLRIKCLDSLFRR
jgi:Cu+-exporting ATPase